MADIDMNNGSFPRSTPEAQGIPSGAILTCLQQIQKSGLDIHSFHVFRNGMLVAGGCPAPFSLQAPRRVYSTMKSVIALGIYLLVQEGKLSLDEPIMKYFPEAIPKPAPEHLEELTVRHVMMMSVGHVRDSLREYHQSRFGIGMIPNTYRDGPQPDVSEAAEKTLPELFFSMPFAYPPGERFFYNNAVPELLGMLIERVSGEEYLQYMRPRLLDPLGIRRYEVQRRSLPDGSSFMDGSTTVITGEDLCKFGLFYLQMGSWEGKQLIDPELIRQGISYQRSTADFVRSAHGMGEKDTYGYGYQVWRNQFGGFRLVGGSGQTCILMPEQQLAVIYTAMDRNCNAPETDVDGMICEHIFKQLSSSPMKEDPQGQQELQRAFDGWSSMRPCSCSPVPAETGWLDTPFTVEQNELGIASVTFLSAQPCVEAVFEDGEQVSLRYGVDGTFAENGCGLRHVPDGYAEIYGAEPERVWISGGWETGGAVLQLQYAGNMRACCVRFILQSDLHAVLELS